MKAFWKYTAARLALFLVTYALLWMPANAVKPRPVVDGYVLLAAILVSGMLALFLLRRLREDFASHITQRAGRMTKRAEQSREATDLD